jgi:hypothetical protein
MQLGLKPVPARTPSSVTNLSSGLYSIKGADATRYFFTLDLRLSGFFFFFFGFFFTAGAFLSPRMAVFILQPSSLQGRSYFSLAFSYHDHQHTFQF